MWFRTLAESVVGVEIDHGVTLEGPVFRASPGSVKGVIRHICAPVYEFKKESVCTLVFTT